ncbi:MAG: hypothetical protein HOD79_01265 [Flavobacteriaceae bacterium]|jgi:hypothetical protein|nr:hypothetical protein [Pelagibacteraceae bacterium]MBT4245964.1 hypothetical protein [Flavobacteriaceae bacterium]MBT4646249.1 hypothetical protein [Pelagibacteraceae bacterium]MBT5215064.1 hypothetical protein [Pelagibacteraceae bacterium]MBT6353291.1 hypothetical protein [Pelagibacteraceae bacterium]
MSIILLKLFHYLAIVFSGGVLVGGGLIQAVYTRANQVPDINVSKVLKILGYLGLASLLVLWITGILLSNLIYGGFSINTAFSIKIIAAAFLLILSFIVNIHVYNSSKNNQPPNKSIMKMATMSGRGLIIVVLLGAAIAFS